ncbi:MAG: reverse transcriptase N-terminal domain-containing protein [Parabacteroides merdae]
MHLQPNARPRGRKLTFARCERKVRKLQIRIAKAQKERSYNKVKALQHLLVTSFEAKVLAVRKVTANKGKRTAGVDHIKWNTYAKKINASEFFETERLQSSPTEKGQHT